MLFKINLTKRVRRRKRPDGTTINQTRYVLNFRDPATGARRQEFFTRHADAQARQNDLVVMVDQGEPVNPKSVPSVADALDHWLADKDGKIKATTFASYQAVVTWIRGPALVGDRAQRDLYRETGRVPKCATLLPLLGKTKLNDLTTAAIRAWHKSVSENAGHYTANRAKQLLKATLALAEEDFGVRAPSMPTGLGRGKQKQKKAILGPEQIGELIAAARQDPERGIYYAFPFLAGTRPSEQLGLLWSEVDFDRDIIRICRIQERDGTLTDTTKTEAGTREIPMSPVLRSMLLDWRVRCPRKGKELHRVFPGYGRPQPWPKPRTGGGGPLEYHNFRLRIWKPAFVRLGLPYVTPHSARHSFISILQSENVEIGPVAKLAGHANPSVTLSHYTQAVRGGQEAVAKLDRAYQPGAGVGS